MSMYPYDVMADESWSRLTRAGDDPADPLRLIILSTGAADGVPESRMMVLRGADRRTARLWFWTDRRAAKVEQLREQPAVTVLLWDRECGVQLRMRGVGEVHEDDELADRHWGQASMSLQAMFAAPETPGEPLRTPDPRLMGMKRSLDAGYGRIARSNFAVIEVRAESIEWLQVIDHEQRRAIMLGATGWAVQPLAP